VQARAGCLNLEGVPAIVPVLDRVTAGLVGPRVSGLCGGVELGEQGVWE
jgi:hypothetical protein